ncbi:MAG: STM4011 family radical SAM protein [Treponema sp.]|jgi:MoaA/NifB/PqqE/SkfB family radical SAM enzyme|nr:STM4011 family radical SAM protein [Treponema sp.]
MAPRVIYSRVIYYRGFLRSCNYRCPYCPFGKSVKSHRGRTRLDRDAKALDRDAKALDRLCGAVSGLGPDLSIMLVPRGEALIHPYYWDALARLCDHDSVRLLACQTNASFSVEAFASRLYRCRDKLRLWCSFHPSQTSMDTFLGQCRLLHERGFRLCAGTVASSESVPLIGELRRRLPPEVYVWINAREGARPLGPEAAAYCGRVDPLFPLETALRPAGPARCYAGRRSFFMEGNGDLFACNISGIKLGNLYRDGLPDGSGDRSRICRARDCHCYLAYVNRTDLPELDRFGAGRFCRLPDLQPNGARLQPQDSVRLQPDDP